MTSDRQKRANAANACKSTGPTTADGRAISSANARRHGLTAAPPWDDVTRYYRVITNDAAARPDPMSRDVRARAALALAEAEAQLARCVAAERRHLVRMAERAGNGAHVSATATAAKKEKGLVDLDVMEQELDGARHARAKKALKRLIRMDPDRPAEIRRRLRTLRRYRRDAETRRRQALRNWREVMQSDVASADLATG